MRREHQILGRLWRALPLAPRSYHLCEDVTVAGAPFQLLEFRRGVAVRGESLNPFPETSEICRRLSALLIDTLATIHAVDLESIGLGDLGRPSGFFRRTTQGWLRRAELTTDGQLTTAMREISRWLVNIPDPAPAAATLLHNDFKLDNILLDTRTMDSVAIVDWDMGSRGDPLFDLATLLSYWYEPGDPPFVHRLAQMPTTHAGFGTREMAAASYAKLTGRSLSDLKPYRVLTMLKLGVVFHQLYQRHRSGETRDPRYATFRALADELLEFTVDIANDKFF